MKQREKILAAVVIALVALVGGKHYYGRYQQSIASRQAEVRKAQSQLADAKSQVAKGRTAIQQLEAWQQRSLPADREKALSLYKVWLLAKAKDAGLAVSDIKLVSTASNQKAFKVIGYELVGSGSLSAVTAMLFCVKNRRLILKNRCGTLLQQIKIQK